MSKKIGYALALSVALSANGAALAEPTVSLPTRQQLVQIAEWVAKMQDLAPVSQMPDVVVVAQEELIRRRYGPRPLGMSKAAAASMSIGGEHSTPRPQSLREVVALYDDNNHTIYLAEGWDASSAAHQSILVHEMTHHLQNHAKQKFPCGGAREKSAYIAQKQWLEERGLDLEKEFQVDMFTVIGMSLCM